MPRNPQTEIQFFNVPWDSGYRNLRYFASEADRDQWFDARNHDSYPDNATVLHAQPVKEGVPYTVSGNWDANNRWNYCRYRNTGYVDGAEWRYAFITGWAYASEHSSTFSFVRDVWMDNIGRISFNNMYIERETTANANDLPEPYSINRTVYRGFTGFGHVTANLKYILVYQGGLVNDLVPDDNPDVTGNSTVDGINQPITIQIFDDIPNLLTTLSSINQHGRTSNVINVYAVPGDLLNVHSKTNFSFKAENYSVNRTKGGYTPLNTKVDKSPFAYGIFGDFFGNEQTFKWEDTSGDANSINFSTFGSVLPAGFRQLRVKIGSPSALYPVTGISHSITFPIGYSVGGFSAWLAQNQANIQQMAYGVHVANVAAEAQTGLAMDLMDKSQLWGNVGSAIGMLGGIAGSSSPLGLLGGVNSALSGTQQMLVNQGIKDATQDNMLQALNNQKAVNLANLNISTDTMMHNAHYVPNSGGVPTGAVGGMYSTGHMSFWCVSAEPCDSERRALDRFFERFGYTVNRIGTPSFSFIRNHYFIKTSGACLHGAMAQEDRNQLMRILDRGVTFWNVDNFNYSI